ncbi:hypothetical protein T08_15354 [Trichinella sp. T8]|nr:hypothetical protein T08_15354 [Trichinella sp. T8]
MLDGCTVCYRDRGSSSCSNNKNNIQWILLVYNYYYCYYRLHWLQLLNSTVAETRRRMSPPRQLR